MDGTPCKPGAYDICVEGKCRVSNNYQRINNVKDYARVLDMNRRIRKWIEDKELPFTPRFEDAFR